MLSASSSQQPYSTKTRRRKKQLAKPPHAMQAHDQFSALCVRIARVASLCPVEIHPVGAVIQHTPIVAIKAVMVRNAQTAASRYCFGTLSRTSVENSVNI
eukprot:GEMP01119246.1.p2 GENE.GEMP01119246.1~~GEMP01119246.1.p2  ORF type:complete len:100 (+),score=19.95 GEMP01119246.1:57-356(+)